MPNRLSARSRSRKMYARSVTSVLGKAMNHDANGTMNCLLTTSKCGVRVWGGNVATEDSMSASDSRMRMCVAPLSGMNETAVSRWYTAKM
jgi:hypothetical protein